MLFWHVAINIGMVSGIPVVGVTLPLISYGGSAVLTTAAALGPVMNVSVRRFSY
jgi:rod shape determining protein RodA